MKEFVLEATDRVVTARYKRRHSNAEDGNAPPEAVPDSGDGGEIQQPPDGLSEAAIREALRDVRDPEIGRDLMHGAVEE